MSFKTFFLLKITIVCLLSFHLSMAQNITTQSPKQYTIGGIEVSGIKNFKKETVISFTGLFVGQKVIIPGEQIPDVIRKLWGLKLFNDVNIYLNKVEGSKVFLEIYVKELPRLLDYKIEGVSSSKKKELKKDLGLEKGKRINENFITNTRLFITKKFKDKGFFDAKVAISLTDGGGTDNTKRMYIRVDKGKKIKIKEINITGNKEISKGRVLKAIKKTKQKRPYRIFKRSKYVAEDYKEDLGTMIDLFKRNGFRDARVLSDSLYREGKYLHLDINLEEGQKYYFGDLKFVGNTVFSDRQLKQLLGIKKGDTYNGVLLDKRIADKTEPNAEDLTNIYQNNGYLFSRISPVEVGVKNDTIDMEIHISEGKLAHFNNIKVEGNDRVNDHVIYRTIRTRPGEVYNKSNIMRTIRELSQLNFFDPQKIAPIFQNVDQNSATLDLLYKLTEKGSSQIQLQGGYGAGGFIGNIGLSFNNFSIKNLFNLKQYKPLPVGDGQKLSLNYRVSQTFNTFSFSFTEPWFGGKRPVGLSVSFYRSTNYLYDRRTFSVNKDRFFNVYGMSLGLSKRLRKPDDYFTLYQGLIYNYYSLSDYNTSLFSFGNGASNSLAYVISFGRDSSGPSPIFPMSGSKFKLTTKLSPPYSLFDGVDYKSLNTDANYKSVDSEGRYINSLGKRVTNPNDAVVDFKKTDQLRYKWLEFYKVNFSADWYLNLISKLVLKTSFNFGLLDSYNENRGLIPFERYFVGGNGLITTTLDGRENIRLRGYKDNSVSPRNDGATVYSKFSMELRYPIMMKPSATIYGLVFSEGGNAYSTKKEFDPFELKRSAGLGIRIFMQQFGLIGFDFGYGFDSVTGGTTPNGWETHFIIGQNF